MCRPSSLWRRYHIPGSKFADENGIFKYYFIFDKCSLIACEDRSGIDGLARP
jgi:hypothetical protein